MNENYDDDTGNSDDGKRDSNEYDNMDIKLGISSDSDSDNIPTPFAINLYTSTSVKNVI